MAALTRLGRRAAVLLVDDEPHVLEGLRWTLRGEAYDVLVAGSAREALEILGRRRIDVVVSDEQMPGMSGSEFLGKVAREWPRASRVMLTGRPTLEAAIRCINDGSVVRFLRKPCMPDELRRSIVAAIESGAGQPRSLDDLHPEERALLSSREREVLTELLEGHRTAQIARALFISTHTVRNHLKAIFRKLDVHSQADLLSRCRR